jgi:hypothetical protein
VFRHASLISAALALGLACLPAHAGQRAFVSSTGSDTNPCTPAAPCRSFQVAHDAVDAGGEIVALDAAGYAPVTITKSVSILGNPGFVAGISVATLYGVTIATPGVNVVLRHLTLNGVGGYVGVHMTNGNALTIENCVISGFTSTGIYASAAADVRIVNTTVRRSDSGMVINKNATVDIVGSRFMGNSTFGLAVFGTPSGATSVSVSDSVSSGNNSHGFVAMGGGPTSSISVSVIRSTAANNNFNGFMVYADQAGSIVRMTVGASVASGNNAGFSNTSANGATATFESMGNNIVRQNTTNAIGTISAVAGL